MKAKAHATAGMVAGGAIAAIPYLASSVPIPPDSESAVGHILLGCAVGALAGAIPDLLEPSKRLGPNHRGLLHSWVVLAALVGVGYFIYKGRITLNPALAWGFVLPGIAGYVSHLAIDLPSKKSLPVLF